MAKFCPNCGTQLNDDVKFCAGCGTQINAPAAPPQGTPPAPPPPFQPPPQQQYQQFSPPQPQQQQYQQFPQQQAYVAAPAPAKKKGKGLKILLGILGGFVALIVLIIVIAFSAVSKAGKVDFYELGNDKIPSVKYVLGEKRKVSNTNTEIVNGVTTKELQYNEPDRDQALEMSQYITYLHDNEGFKYVTDVEFSTPEAWAQVGRNSNDAGYQLVVQIEYNAKGYTITIVKEPGEVTPNGGETPADPFGTPTTNPAFTPTPTNAPTPTGTNSLTAGIFNSIESGNYHMKLPVPVEDMGEVEFDYYFKGGMAAMLFSVQGTDYRMVERDGKSYTILDAEEAMKVTDTVAGEEMGGLETSGMTFVGTGSGTFNGGTCPYDEYTNSDGDHVFFFVRSGSLIGVRTMSEGEPNDVRILAFDGNVSDSVFDIPTDYQLIEGE